MRITVTEKRPNPGLMPIAFLFLLGLAVAYSIFVFQTQMVWVGVVAGCASFAGLLHSLWRHHILLQIDEFGIFDQRLGIGRILWTDVEDVQLFNEDGHRYLCFQLKDPDLYLSRLSGTKQKRIRYNHSLGFRGFNVDIGPVNINPIDLKKFVDVRVGNKPRRKTPKRKAARR